MNEEFSHILSLHLANESKRQRAALSSIAELTIHSLDQWLDSLPYTKATTKPRGQQSTPYLAVSSQLTQCRRIWQGYHLHCLSRIFVSRDALGAELMCAPVTHAVPIPNLPLVPSHITQLLAGSFIFRSSQANRARSRNERPPPHVINKTSFITASSPFPLGHLLRRLSEEVPSSLACSCDRRRR